MKFHCLCLFIFGVFLKELASIEASGQLVPTYFYYNMPQYPRDCKEVYEQCNDKTESGIFMIQPDGAPEPFNVHCNNTIDGGGWTVFQRRMDGSVDFFRYWDDYKNGFGFLQREFWLGNDKLSYLTNQGDYELRIDLVSRNDISYFAKYDLFRISDEFSKYRMTDIGRYLNESTTSDDAMAFHRNMSFSTRDRDNDLSKEIAGNCAQINRGAWWYKACHKSNLNGLYSFELGSTKTIFWRNLPGGQSNIKYSEMKIRPLSGN